MKKLFLPILLMLTALSSLGAYTVFPDFKGKSFILGTETGSYTIDNTVLTERLEESLQVEKYADNIWLITDAGHSSLIIMTDNRPEIDTALFTLSYLKADTTAIISPYTSLREQDISAISPDFLFQMEFPGEVQNQANRIQLHAGDIIEIEAGYAWTWSMRGEERTIYIICPDCGNEIALTVPWRIPD